MAALAREEAQSVFTGTIVDKGREVVALRKINDPLAKTRLRSLESLFGSMDIEGIYEGIIEASAGLAINLHVTHLSRLIPCYENALSICGHTVLGEGRRAHLVADAFWLIYRPGFQHRELPHGFPRLQLGRQFPNDCILGSPHG